MDRPSDTGLLQSYGPQELTVRKALLARIRSIDSDHVRTGRQRAVVSAIFKKFGELSLPKKLQPLRLFWKKHTRI